LIPHSALDQFTTCSFRKIEAMNVAAQKDQTGFAWMRKLSRRHLLGSAALLALCVPASANDIDSLSQWDGFNRISSWGAPNTSTYGQTFTPTGTQQTRMTSFTMELQQGGGTPPQYQAFVYQFTNNRITGPALFTSSVFTAPATTTTTFAPVTINTGSVVLTPGQQYVVFLTLSTLPAQPASSYRYGALTTNTAIPNGQFVFMNNGTVFGDLSANPWSNIGEDLAVIIALNGFLSPLLPANAPINPTNVAGGIDKFINAGGTLPAGFNNLFALTPAQLVDALGALSGENHTQAQQGAFQLGNSYLSLLTDPFATNRVGTTGPLGFAPERQSMLPGSIASAYAKYNKAPALAVYEPRWDVWGAAFGGTNNTKGDPAVVGSHDAYTRAGAVAAGADYRWAPGALVGFSLAGGNTNWSVTGNGFGGNGGGTSDAFMAGIYGKYTAGPAYVSAALTYANYWMSTARIVTVAGLDQLKADFNAESWGGRIEGGYRLPTNYFTLSWTPYAAFTGQSFHTPNYGEIATAGSNQFALNVASRTATAYRGELGVRTDKVMAVDNGGQVNLFGKVAYAYDSISNPAAAASFAALGPGSNFIVFGARPSQNLALSTSGVEWRLASGLSFMVKADSEWGDRSHTYTGTGRIRYTW
jgi:outer membrane autotransporter protein